MNPILITGCGVVSPAGWGISPFSKALEAGIQFPTTLLPVPGQTGTRGVRSVPPPDPRPVFLAQARIRRASPISHYAMAAALEALGRDADRAASGGMKLGIVFCTMAGCVNYSKRFYGEVLHNPKTASPLLFPETVLNAPASHLASLLGASSRCCTLVGDVGVFFQGMALAAEWLAQGVLDATLVVASEEADWLTSDSLQLFRPGVVASEGAAAVCLKRGISGVAGVKLGMISAPFNYTSVKSRQEAARGMVAQLMEGKATCELLVEGCAGDSQADALEADAWSGWRQTRLSPLRILGESFAAGGGWRVAAAWDFIHRGKGSGALISAVGHNQFAIGARIEAEEKPQP